MKHIYIAGFMALGCALTLPSYANTLTLVNQSGVDLTVNNTQGSPGGGDVKSGETKTLTVDANTAYQMTYISQWGSPQGVLTMKQDPTSYSIQHTAVNPASGLLNLQVMINGGRTVRVTGTLDQPVSKSGILFDGTIDEIPVAIQIDADDHYFTLHAGAHSLPLRLYPAHAAAYIEHMPEPQTGRSDNVVAAPMPGLLTAVMVAVGDRVEQGQDVAIIEAMKMENVLNAGMSGIVGAIEAATGANLNVDEVILTIISDD